MNDNIKDFTEYTPPSWDEWFMKMAYLASYKSKDTRSKVGAVLVRHNRILALGYNGMPIKVDDSVESRYARPLKYDYFEHAERNVLYSAAYNGIITKDSIMYTQWTPCADCARGAIQAGVSKIVIHRQYNNVTDEIRKVTNANKWATSSIASNEMFKESGMEIVVLDSVLGERGYFDGKVFAV